MAYMKFKELTKYFDFSTEILNFNDLPEYVVEYVEDNESVIIAYKNRKDFVVFTDKKMVLFDRDVAAIYYKKVHIVPFKSISSAAINYVPNKVELLFSLDSGYQLHINFVNMNHDKKENLKKLFKIMMKTTL